MLHFECDYTRGAHPKIIERLAETNLESTPGYGEDEYCEAAREKIRAAVGKMERELVKAETVVSNIYAASRMLTIPGSVN